MEGLEHESGSPSHIMVLSTESTSRAVETGQASEAGSQGVCIKVKIKMGDRPCLPSTSSYMQPLAKKMKQDFTPRHLELDESTSGTVIAEDDVCLVVDTQPRPFTKGAKISLPRPWTFNCEEPTKSSDKYVSFHLKKTNLTCKYCPMTFDNEKLLELHDKTHNKYRCSLCSFCCSDNKNMSKHLKTYHSNEQNIHQCKLCFYKSKSKIKLENHTKLNHIVKYNYYCVTCSKSFSTKKELNTHEQQHKQNVFPCVSCKNTYSSRHSLLSHNLCVHRCKDMFICPTCKKSFNTSGQFTHHISQHTNELPFGCNQCEYICAQYSDLKVHLISVHGKK